MFFKNDKRRLYWLIELYLLNNINASTFCDEYEECYNLELDYDTLTPLETKVFAELNDVVVRFSPFEEDLKQYPGTYFDENQLKHKIIETNKLLSIA